MTRTGLEICCLIALLVPVELSTTNFSMDKNLRWIEELHKSGNKGKILKEHALKDFSKQSERLRNDIKSSADETMLSVSGQTETGLSVFDQTESRSSVSGQKETGSSVFGQSEIGSSVSGRTETGSSVFSQPETGSSMFGQTETGSSVFSQPETGSSMFGQTETGPSGSGQTETGSLVFGQKEFGLLVTGQGDTGPVPHERQKRRSARDYIEPELYNSDINYKCGLYDRFSYASYSDDSVVLDFQAPCCATKCSYSHFLNWHNSVPRKIEFLEFDIQSPLSIALNGQLFCKDSYLAIHPTFQTFCGDKNPKPLETFVDRLVFRVATEMNYQCQESISFKINITKIVAENRCPAQHTVIQDGHSGLITSPGYKEEEEYNVGEKCEWRITVANDCLLQISFEVFELVLADSLQIYEFSTSFGTNDVIFFDMGAQMSERRIRRGYYFTLPTHTAEVDYIARDGVNLHFKLHYKAVSKDNFIPLEPAFPYLRLNCIGYEQSLPQPILCDFWADCAGKEDERNCSYTDSTVCPRGVVFGFNCYIELSKVSTTQRLAEEKCAQTYNGHLMTMNTEEEKNFILDLIDAKQITFVLLGLLQMSFDDDLLYRRLYQGLDGVTIFGGFWHQFDSNIDPCTVWKQGPEVPHMQVESVQCKEYLDWATYFCEVKISPQVTRHLIPSKEDVWTGKVVSFQCSGSEERISLSRRCDGASDCFDGSDETGCADVTDTSNYFFCQSGTPLWYSHVCDVISDCEDNSDEEFCLSVPDDDPGLAVCVDGAPISSSLVCDAKPDCLDGSDELDCLSCNGGAILCPSVGCMPREWVDDDWLDCPIQDRSGQWFMEPDFVSRTLHVPPPPGVVMPDGYGKVTIQPLNGSDPCPSTHAQCPRGYCIPIYMLCNGYKDCPEGEDELPETCQSFCKGRYKCHQTSICLHDDHVCDGWNHCPLHDDETLCPGHNSTCPLGCECLGREMICYVSFPLHNVGCLKRLDISNTHVQNTSLAIRNHCLIALIARNSGIRELGELNMVNLYKLDLSDNDINHLPVGVFDMASNIHDLSLARNNFDEVDLQQIVSLNTLEVLDISGNALTRLRSSTFTCCSKLKVLKLDDMGITTIESKAFRGTQELQFLSMLGNPISIFEPSIFSDVPELSILYTDNYKLCCPVIMPRSLSTGICQAPSDEISSCEDILRTPVYRAFLWLMAILTIVGNSSVLVYKFCMDRQPSKLGYATFITSLSVSDLFMGIYLAIIGGADQMFKGQYLWEADAWKSSRYCSLAGFLSMTSSEVSAMTICMITLDRYLVLAFPLSTVRLTPKRARVVVLVTWMLGAILAGIPLLPPLSHWQFYSQNGVCVPLPITRTSFPGSDYAFVIFIVFNFAIFVSIAVGQVLIFRSVRASSRKFKGTGADRRGQDAEIARKLALVVISDFLCWFPIGIMGLLARVAVPIPGEANVLSTIFILPLNSAINPFLYTVPAVVAKIKELKAKARSQRRRDQSSSTGSTAIRGRGERSRRGRSSGQGMQIATTSAHAGQGNNTEVCMSKLRVWLKSGRISTDTVMRILAEFRGNCCNT